MTHPVMHPPRFCHRFIPLPTDLDSISLVGIGTAGVNQKYSEVYRWVLGDGVRVRLLRSWGLYH